MWDPAVYHRYGSERARPFFDLVARIGAEKPRARSSTWAAGRAS